MSEFSLELAEEFARIATMLTEKANASVNTQRAALYNALVSVELSLKHTLERAGWSHAEIKNLGHDLHKLLCAVVKLTILADIEPAHPRRIRASQLLAIEIAGTDGSSATVGKMIDAIYDPLEAASRYPGQLRYGKSIKHFPAEAVAMLATKIACWTREHVDTIKR